jgi:hypothetical protein
MDKLVLVKGMEMVGVDALSVIVGLFVGDSIM